MTATVTAPASGTPAQVKFIRSLHADIVEIKTHINNHLEAKGLPTLYGMKDDNPGALVARAIFDRREGSKIIDMLKTARTEHRNEARKLGVFIPRVTTPVSKPDVPVTPAPKMIVQEGETYVLGTDVYFIAKSKTSGHLFAKIWDGSTAKFVYAGGAIFKIQQGGRLMTIEEAAEFGKKTVVCAICTRRLKTEESKKRGIGPTCFARLQGRTS